MSNINKQQYIDNAFRTIIGINDKVKEKYTPNVVSIFDLYDADKNEVLSTQEQENASQDLNNLKIKIAEDCDISSAEVVGKKPTQGTEENNSAQNQQVNNEATPKTEKEEVKEFQNKFFDNITSIILHSDIAYDVKGKLYSYASEKIDKFIKQPLEKIKKNYDKFVEKFTNKINKMIDKYLTKERKELDRAEKAKEKVHNGMIKDKDYNPTSGVSGFMKRVLTPKKYKAEQVAYEEEVKESKNLHFTANEELNRLLKEYLEAKDSHKEETIKACRSRLYAAMRELVNQESEFVKQKVEIAFDGGYTGSMLGTFDGGWLFSPAFVQA